MKKGDLVRNKKTKIIGVYIGDYLGSPIEKIVFYNNEEWVFFVNELEVIDVQSK